MPADTEPRSWVEEARAAMAAGVRERVRDALAFRPREIAALALVALAVVLGAGVAFVRALPREAASSAARVSLEPVAASVTPSPEQRLVVHVAGAVMRPGVYELPPGARVVDALRAAGGAAPGADASSMNLAEPLADGRRVYVPRRGETPPPAAGTGTGSGGGGGASGKVNINTAGVAELDTLPGVGPVLAQRIVDYRTQHGPFRDVRDLLKVEGIGQKKFDSLEDLVTV